MSKRERQRGSRHHPCTGRRGGALFYAAVHCSIITSYYIFTLNIIQQSHRAGISTVSGRFQCTCRGRTRSDTRSRSTKYRRQRGSFVGITDLSTITGPSTCFRTRVTSHRPLSLPHGFRLGRDTQATFYLHHYYTAVLRSSAFFVACALPPPCA